LDRFLSYVFNTGYLYWIGEFVLLCGALYCGPVKKNTGLKAFGFAIISWALFGFLFLAFGYRGGLTWALSVQCIAYFWGPPLIVGTIALWFASCRRRLPTCVSLCQSCGYDLRGQIEPRCPECGTTFDQSLVKDKGLGDRLS
jgi:hypothetical protein